MSISMLSISDHWIVSELNGIASRGFERISCEDKERAIALLDALQTNQTPVADAIEDKSELDFAWDETDDASPRVEHCVHVLRDGHIFEVA